MRALQGRIQPKRAIKHNIVTYTRVPVSMITWHSYTTHPTHTRRALVVGRLVVKLSDSDNRNETFGRLVLERRPGAVVVRLGRVQVARGHDARRGRQHVVAPRRVDADRAGVLEEVAADFVMENRPTSIIQRAASVEEVAAMIAYVASPLSSATTGASLRVDGGVVDSL